MMSSLHLNSINVMLCSASGCKLFREIYETRSKASIDAITICYLSLIEAMPLWKTPQSYNKKSTYAKKWSKFSQKSYFCSENEHFLSQTLIFLQKNDIRIKLKFGQFRKILYLCSEFGKEYLWTERRTRPIMNR